jgi:hypothetical protein
VEKSIPSRPVSAKIFLVFMESEYPEREYKIKKKKEQRKKRDNNTT